jgi:hypothetical protein
MAELCEKGKKAVEPYTVRLRRVEFHGGQSEIAILVARA